MATTRMREGARSGKTTIRDVATEAGVSTAAVSKVLHGSRSTIGVSEARAQKIRAVAERLHYVPNLLARGLRRGTTGDIGLVFESFRGLVGGPRYDALVFEGIAEVLFERGLRLTILPEMKSPEAVSHLHDGRLDGAIWCRLDRGTLAFPLGEVTIPIVAMNAPHAFEAGANAMVSCDNAGGARRVAEHLFALGHRHTAFIAQAQEIQAPDTQDRLAGFQSALADLGAPETEVLYWHDDAREFDEWHHAHPEITALFAWSESMAGQALLRAEAAGIPVPERLSVVGFDSTSYCEGTRPPLTAVRQPLGEMARHSARLLLDMIDGQFDPLVEPPVFDTPLDVRRSTGPAPSMLS